jgi:hypothetical protein
VLYEISFQLDASAAYSTEPWVPIGWIGTIVLGMVSTRKVLYACFTLMSEITRSKYVDA